MKLKRVVSVADAFKRLLRSEYLYDYYGNAVEVNEMKVGDLGALFCRTTTTTRRMMTAEEAVEWRSKALASGEDWIIQVNAGEMWRSLYEIHFENPMDDFRRARLIKGKPFTPINFSIKVEE